MSYFAHRKTLILHSTLSCSLAANGVFADWKVFESVEATIKDGNRLCPSCEFK